MRLLSAFLFLCAMTDTAAAQLKKERLIGAWQYVESFLYVVSDNSRIDQFGKTPDGLFILLENGWYSHIIMRPDLPQIKAGSMMQATPEEARLIAIGTLSHYGTYEVDSDAATFTVKIHKSDFPNFNGRTQTRTVLQLDDEILRYVNDVTNAGPGTVVVATLKRVKPSR